MHMGGNGSGIGQKRLTRHERRQGGQTRAQSVFGSARFVGLLIARL